LICLIMKLSDFDNRLDKIGLALMSGVEAKNDSVKEFGIGEDLSMNLFLWRANRLKIMLQLRSDIQKLNQRDRFSAVTDALAITRKAWGIDAVSLISEGYFSEDPEKTKDIELKTAFLDPNSGVSECLTVAHVEDGYVTFVVKPYRYDVPRTVVWGDEIYHPGSSMVRDQNGMYPNMFHRVVTTIEPERDDEIFDKDTYYETISTGLYEAGFFIQQWD
jgi:hypothetical protein